MNRAWRMSVARLCRDAWKLNPHRIRRVVDEIEVLIATDQLSEFSVAGVLDTVGLRGPAASEAARSIRAAIGSATSAAGPPRGRA
jgi:hypothetical protein